MDSMLLRLFIVPSFKKGRGGPQFQFSFSRYRGTGTFGLLLFATAAGLAVGPVVRKDWIMHTSHIFCNSTGLKIGVLWTISWCILYDFRASNNHVVKDQRLLSFFSGKEMKCFHKMTRLLKSPAEISCVSPFKSDFPPSFLVNISWEAAITRF